MLRIFVWKLPGYMIESVVQIRSRRLFVGGGGLTGLCLHARMNTAARQLEIVGTNRFMDSIFFNSSKQTVSLVAFEKPEASQLKVRPAGSISPNSLRHKVPPTNSGHKKRGNMADAENANPEALSFSLSPSRVS